MTDVFVYTREFILDQKEHITPTTLPQITNILQTIIEDAAKSKTKNKKHNENTWRKKKPVIKALEYKDEMDKLSKKMNINLNKLSDKNYEAIKVLIIEFIESEIVLDILLNLLFDKAVAQPTYCKIYVKLCNDICKLDINERSYIQDILFDKCNEMISKFKDTKNTLSNVEDYDNFCKDTKNKLIKMGSLQFIGELYNIDLINYPELSKIITELFENVELFTENNLIELFIDSICKLINTIWDKYLTEKKADFEKSISIIDSFIKNKDKFTAKVRFKMMDVIDKYKYKSK